MTEETEQLTCERCESAEPASVYDPRTAGHPHKRVILCEECAQKDSKAVLDETKSPAPVPEPMLRGEALDKIVDEAVDEAIDEVFAGVKTEEDKNELETIKFPKAEPKVGTKIEEKIVTPQSKRPKASKNLAKDVETPVPMTPEETRQEYERQRKDVAELKKNLEKLGQERQALGDKIISLRRIITAKQGAVAAYAKTLGIRIGDE